MAEYPGAIDAFVDQSRVFIGQNSHSAIVLHGTGGSPDQTVQQLGAYFATTPAMTSVHYAIDRAGNVAQYVRESDGAAGNCCIEPGYDAFWNQFNGDNLNLHTISIEHVNDSANSLPLTDAQKQASFRLIAYLCKKYNIPYSHIKSHASIAPQSRAACPGPAYPWQELQAFLNGGNSMVPQGWQDDGKNTLRAPNGILVTDGFRLFVLNNNWYAANWPVTPAVGIPGGSRQTFEFGELEWTPQTGVYPVKVGEELQALRTQNSDLQKQVQQGTNTQLQTVLKDRENRLNQISQIARISQ